MQQDIQSVEQPQGSTNESASFEGSSNQSTSVTQQITDLDKLEKFTFQGKEWTPSELKSAYMAQADYTKKTQQVAQEQKFMNNLSADIDAVRANSSLAEEFKRVYPQKYHQYLKYAGAVEDKARTQAQPTKQESDPEIGTLKSEVQQLKDHYQKIQMAELESQFSNIYNSQIKDKYKFVDEDKLAGLAREALSMGYQLRDEHGKMDANVIEKLAKYEHDRLEKKFQEYQKATMNQQRAANSKARDIGSGGGIAGQAPKKMSFADASKEYERMLTGSQQ